MMKSAYLKKVRLFFRLRADACRFGIGEADRLFRLRGWRTRGLRSRPLVNHRSQRRGSSPLDSTPASGSTSFFFLKRCSMGHNASSILDYRGQFHVRETKVAQDTLNAEDAGCLVRLSPAKVQRASARSSPDGSLCTPCLDRVESANTFKLYLRR